MARGLKFRIYEVEELYFPSSENKGADQLRGYREADLRLSFRILQKAGFLITWLISYVIVKKIVIMTHTDLRLAKSKFGIIEFFVVF